MVDANISQQLQDLANVCRIDCIEMVEAAGSGHPTTCSSAADLLTTLFFHPDVMHYHPDQPKNFANDRFVLSKGHAAPLLYALWYHNGFLDKDILKTLRRIDSPLEGHPTPKLDFVDVGTGSLGQGLSVSCGMAYASKYIDKINNRYYCMMGDGETVEGSVWEACHFASYYKLDNLTAIIDVNGLGQSGYTSLRDEGLQPYADRFKSFGWETILIDGHNIDDCIKAFQEARKDHGGKPFAIIAKTYKGRNFTKNIEDQLNWHGKALGKEATKAIDYLKSLIKDLNVKITPVKPDFEAKTPEEPHYEMPVLDYDQSKEVAIRTGYGNALKRLAANDKTNALLSVDGDTKASTYACVLEAAYPQKFIEGFIAEQNMVGVGQGLACRKKICFISTFAAFLTRAFDQMRMGTISLSNIKYVGSHAGVSLGEDGASQMALEDFAMFRSLIGSVCFYPSDAVSCENAVFLAANYKGAVYIRTSRPNSPVIYKNDEKFEIGKAKVVIRSDDDKLTVATAGITLVESKKAIEKLKGEGINVRLVDLFTIKPIDEKTLAECVSGTNGKLYVVEEHGTAGGIFEAVSGALAEHGFKIYHTSVEKLPRSGKPDDLLRMYGLTSSQIEERIRQLV